MNGSIEEPRLVDRIASSKIPLGQVTAWWLGGSGFVLKTPAGTQIYLDPYLSDSVNGIFGQSRAFPPPIAPEEARPTVVVSSHSHEDHLDPGTIPVIARHSPSTQFIMPPSALSRALGWGVPRDRATALTEGQSIHVEDVVISHAPARHVVDTPGWEVPDAMGVILTIGNLTIYHSGDTEYDIRLRLLHRRTIDVFMVCINGVGGNMNAHEAALLAHQLNSRISIPMHHYLWATNTAGDEATLDPAVFAETYRKLGGSGRVVIPEIGMPIEIPNVG
jgi:L-ascorbate 6-phosphate lactonase